MFSVLRDVPVVQILNRQIPFASSPVYPMQYLVGPIRDKEAAQSHGEDERSPVGQRIPEIESSMRSSILFPLVKKALKNSYSYWDFEKGNF